MSKAPSEKTQLATAKRTIRSLQTEVQNLCAEVTRYRSRATQAEQSAVAWRDRFDKLLAAMGEQTSLGKGEGK
jgi:FtsZ-binding cell division protein ZapB